MRGAPLQAVAWGVIPMFAVVLYLAGLGGPLLFDDFASVGALLRAQGLPDDWLAYVLSPTGPLKRPVSMLSFLANAALNGDDLRAWKATNLALHCGIGLLIGVLVQRLLSCRPEFSTRLATGLALFVAAWWTWHPLHVSTVLYTVQRMTQLSALFTLSGVLLHVDTRLRGRDDWRSRIRLWTVYVAFLPLAALSKETGVLLPALVGVLEFTALRGLGDPGLRRHARHLLALFLLLPLTIAIIYYGMNFEARIWEPHVRRGFTPWERLLTQARVLLEYLGQVVAPSRARLGFFHDDTTLSTSLFSPPATAGACTLLAALALGAVVLRHRAPLVAAGVLWFFAGHLLESSIFPLELMFEHRNYLPSFGILFAVTAAVGTWRNRPAARLGIPAALTLLGLNAFVASSIVQDWSTEERMYAAFYQAHPGSPNAASQFAEMLAARGRFADAERVLAPLPGAGPTIHRWYLQCRQHGQLDAAALTPGVLVQDPVLTTYAVTGLIELAKLALDARCALSAAALRRLVSDALARPTVIRANHQKLAVYSGHLAWAAGDRAGAFAALEHAYALKPVDPVPLLLLCEWQIAAGARAEAGRTLARAETVAAASLRDYTPMLAAVRALLRTAADPADAGGGR